jgi:hypothetical protein
LRICSVFGNQAYLNFRNTVYPGDQVKSLFAIDNLTGKWHDGWSVARGQQGHVAKQVPFSGNMTFDPSIASRLSMHLEGQQGTTLTMRIVVPDRVPYTMVSGVVRNQGQGQSLNGAGSPHH